MPRSVSRRRFLATAATALPVLAVPGLASAEPAIVMAPTRALSFAHTHTGERLAVEYFKSGRYLPGALSDLNRLLRDFRTGDVWPIDPNLFDLLHQLQLRTGVTYPYQIISGYRSPKSNAALRERSNGVAAASLHMSGRAIDIRVDDVSLSRLRDAALSLQLGGVGYYPGSNFVHVDTGRVRRW